MTLLIVKKKNQSAFKAIERKNQRGTSACMASWQRDKVCTSWQLLHGAGDSPAHTCTSEVVREIPRHSTEDKGAFCKGRVRHHRFRGRSALTTTTTTVIKTMASFCPHLTLESAVVKTLLRPTP